MKNIMLNVTTLVFILFTATEAFAHGTVIYPMSRVYRVYKSNPENPNWELARRAVGLDGKASYYTWNELSRNIPEAVEEGLPPGFDYAPWVHDGQLASGGRVDPESIEYPRTYRGLDQVSSDWPTTEVNAGETITVDFLVTAAHSPSVWDVWMTTDDWDANTALNWTQMEYLDRPDVKLENGHYLFDLKIPMDRRGHHVLWVAWQRDDPAGEVFFSTSDINIVGGLSCDNIRRLRYKCTKSGKLKAMVKSYFPEGTILTMSRNGSDVRSIIIKANGRGIAKWRQQSGTQVVCIVECETCGQSNCP